MPKFYYYDNNDTFKPFSFYVFSNGSIPFPDGVYTTVAPSFEPGKYPCFNGDDWDLIEDHRGEIGYINDVPFQITTLGPYPEGFTLTPPPPSQEEINAALKATYLKQLEEIDQKSIRTLRELEVLLIFCQENPEEITQDITDQQAYLTEKIKDFNDQADTIRAEMALLSEAS
jgi:hypothetical protein